MVRFRNLRGEQQEEEAPEPEAGLLDEEQDELLEQEEPAAPMEAEEEDELELDDETDDLLDEADDEPLEIEDEPSEPEEEPPMSEAGDQSALKELAARMSVLQSNLESVQGTRTDIEDKLAQMEERMMRLGSLAEAVSSEYNPFIAENSPEEPTWEGERASPASPLEEEPAPEPKATPPKRAEPPAAAEAPMPEPEPAPQAEPDPAPSPSPSPEPEPAPQAEAEPSRRELEALEAFAPDRQTASDAVTAAEALSKDRPTLGGSLEEKFMMLEWVGLMLRRVGRGNLLDLLEYYQSLGWLEQGMRNRIIRVATGIDAPERAGESEWRGDLDLHERSLVTIERLRGNEITAADVEGLRMDMRRFFGE